MRGAKPVPTELKLIRGNKGHALSITSRSGPPDKPEWLEGEASLEWDRVVEGLTKLGLVERADRAALAAYCVTYAKWEAVELLLRAEGLLSVNAHGVGLNPLARHALELLSHLRAFCVEFGFTPSSRGRLEIPRDLGGERGDLDEFLGGAQP